MQGICDKIVKSFEKKFQTFPENVLKSAFRYVGSHILISFSQFPAEQENYNIHREFNGNFLKTIKNSEIRIDSYYHSTQS